MIILSFHTVLIMLLTFTVMFGDSFVCTTAVKVVACNGYSSMSDGHQGLYFFLAKKEP